jgi:putative inorganic carbon (HCO3(-)) transporter
VRMRMESAFRPRGDLDSNEFRIVCWRTGWQMIKAHPVLGLGPEMVRLKFADYVPADIPRPLPAGWYGHLHNVYIHYAAERGIPAMLAIIAVLAKLLLDFGKALRSASDGRRDPAFLIHGAIACVIAIAVSGFFELNLGYSEVLTVFLAVAALGYTGVQSLKHV